MPPVTPGAPAASGALADSEKPPAPPDLAKPRRPWPGLDRLGAIQASGGLILGLIALFSSYDHITIPRHTLQLQQQWGIPLLAASVATVFIDAQLATRARDRGAHEVDRERNRADQERNRAAEARERQAKSAERQNAALDLLRRSALLSARLQLDPSEANRTRLRAFLTLMAPQPLDNEDTGKAG